MNSRFSVVESRELLYNKNIFGMEVEKCKRQILMRLDTKLLQPFASWSNSL